MCDMHHNKFSKREFIEFLEENNVSIDTIVKFSKSPEVLKCGVNIFKLNIEIIFNGTGNTSYDFELNYYCEELIEFLFNYKIFNNVEQSIDYLSNELKRKAECE